VSSSNLSPGGSGSGGNGVGAGADEFLLEF